MSKSIYLYHITIAFIAKNGAVQIGNMKFYSNHKRLTELDLARASLDAEKLFDADDKKVAIISIYRVPGKIKDGG